MVRVAWDAATASTSATLDRSTVEPAPDPSAPSTTGVLVVTLDRPERRNAVDHATLLALRDAQRDAAGARVLVLTGTPPAFCAGADLTGVEEGAFTQLLGDVLRGFTGLPIPTIAAIDGAALGAGAQLAVACDLRVATPDSRFGVPAAKLGLAVDHWTVERLARELGWPVARAMLLGAETYRGAALHLTGAVHRLGGLDEALAWAREIAGLAPLTIAAHKLALETSGPEPVADEAVEVARLAAWASADAVEGRQAFLAKRPARFTGA
ncbi:MAG: enoyl-CoA hydratase-related protein [Ilumatobacteraceae bacterium]